MQQNNNSNLESAILSVASAILTNAIASIASNSVLTSQTTTSTSFTNLTTVGPEVTVEVKKSGVLLILWADEQYVSTTNNTYSSIALSGANTLSASDTQSLINGTTALFGAGTFLLLTGLNQGSTTVTMKYRTTGGTATFRNRRMAVLAL